ncbi:MAG: hypothetical protein WBP93_20485 [Pyrinomonadaceae bacterium]
MTVIEVLSIILSIVSLIITTVGFFASLKFYRDGVQLQKLANDALIKLEEKTQTIQSQVSGMFERTLDAAIGGRNELSKNFEELNEQLEKAQARIIEESVKQVGAANEKERAQLSQIVDSQLDLIRAKIETTRESAGEVTFNEFLLKNPDADIGTKITALLSIEGRPMSGSELRDRLSGWARYETLQRRLRELLDKGVLISFREKRNVFFRLNSTSGLPDKKNEDDS